MAQKPTRLGLTRDQLASFLNDFEQIKQFEKLFASVDQINNVSLDEISIAADNAGAAANEAQAGVDRLEDEVELTSLAPSIQNNTSESTDYIDFHTTAPVPVSKPGRLSWNPGDGTLDLGMGYDSVTQQIGLEQYYRIKADAAISDGQCIMFTGAVGASGVLKGAPATGVTDGQRIMGVATMDIANNGFGYVTSFGLVRGIDTTGASVGETWADGDILYYNPAYVGGLTNVMPVAPLPKIVVAAVVRAGSGGSGSLFVRVQPEPNLQALSDVYAPSPITNGQLLIGDGPQSRWEAATLTAGGNVTITNAPGAITISATDAFVGTVTSVDVSGGTTGLTTTGGPITTSGTITIGGTLNVASGGTGASTAFTAGSIVFAGASGVYSQDNANLNWDDTNNTLGIGRTASANVRVYSKGGTSGSGAFQFYGENSAATGCFGVRDDGGFYTGQAANSPYNLTTTASPNVVVGADGYLYRSTAALASGTVTSVSVASANGFAGTVANATTTPAITISTTITGILKGNGTAISAASEGTDYVAPGAVTTSGLTMATARLLGRTTASTGAIEEITVGSGLSLSGGSLANSAPDQTVTLTAGTGISTSGTYPSFTITNTAPDQVVSLTGAGTTSITGTYPNFTITSNDAYTGTVTSVSGTGSVNGITLSGTVTSSGSITLGGSLSNVSLTSQVTGTLPVGNGGTGTATAFTIGSVIFATTSGVYAQDNSNFHWDNTNKTLGVGRQAASNVRIYAKGGTTGSGAFQFYGINSANTGCFGIRDDGAFYTGQASLSPYNLTTAAAANLVVAADYYLYRSTSSARYKKNIVDYDRGLDAVMSLRPVYYEGKGEIDDGKKFAGFIAEEVYDSGLTEFVVLDEDGKPDALHYGNMTALLASAIKEIGQRLARIEAALEIKDGSDS